MLELRYYSVIRKFCVFIWLLLSREESFGFSSLFIWLLLISSSIINSESLASESQDLFWRFVGEFSLKEDDQSNEEKQYNQALNTAKQFLSPIQLDLLQYSMALRYFR